MLGGVASGCKTAMVLHPGGALTRTEKSDVPHRCGTSLFFGCAGDSKGGGSPFWRTTLLARSSVLCLPSGWREKPGRRHMGGMVLSDRKTGRDFRAGSEEITACFL